MKVMKAMEKYREGHEGREGNAGVRLASRAGEPALGPWAGGLE